MDAGGSDYVEGAYASPRSDAAAARSILIVKRGDLIVSRECNAVIAMYHS